MTNRGCPSPEVARDKIYDAISLFIGRGRRYQVDDIEAATGIPERTVSSWIAADPLERRAPKGWHLVLLASFLGTRFSSKILAPAGQGAHSLNPEPGDPEVIIAELVDGTAEFTKRGLDRVYCHIDRGALEPVADRMIDKLTPFSSKARRDG